MNLRRLLLHLTLFLLISIPFSGAAPGWLPLFNGKDLAGWHLRKPDGPDLWKVKNGAYSTAA